MLLAFAGAASIGEASDNVALFSPAMAGLNALSLWCMVSLRQPARLTATRNQWQAAVWPRPAGVAQW